MSKIVIETSVYNERRYGKPWIAKVTFDSEGKAVFDFGNWVGETGGEGLLELEVIPGDIVAKGQKDNRKPSNSAPDYYIYTSETKAGEYGDSVSKKAAYLHSKETVSIASLRAEREQLIERLTKIDQLLTLSGE